MHNSENVQNNGGVDKPGAGVALLSGNDTVRAHIFKAHACSFVYVCCGRQKLTPGTIPYCFPHYHLETESLLNLKLVIVARIVDQTILRFTYLRSPQPVLGLKTPGSTCLGSLPVTAGAAGHAARGKFNVGVWAPKSVPHACSVSTFTPSHLFRPNNGMNIRNGADWSGDWAYNAHACLRLWAWSPVLQEIGTPCNWALCT